ncbi:MAG: FIST C-terminal domain-containing protein [Treponema sp.]|nr:FIST C-terminal domain-containing protein [Treponema sp.]
MEQEVVQTRMADISAAVGDLCSKLKKSPDSYQAVIFYAAITYDFAELSTEIKKHFPNSEVIGASTAGEISRDGFLNNTILLTTMSDPRTRVKGVFIDNGSKYPVASRNDIEKALSAVGIRCNDPSSHKDAFAIAYTNGVFNAEETILSNFYSIIQNDNFRLAGGTAGFTGDEAKTFVSYNGRTTQDGAVMLFVKTQCKFDIRQEDIFNPTGKSFFVNESNPMKREISRFDGMPAKTAYAQKLGVSEAQAESMTFENPFGRMMNGALHIVALAGFTPDKKISTFARVVPNSTLELMHIGNALEKADETCNGIKSVIPLPKFTIMMSCITRALYFERENLTSKIVEKYKNAFPTFAGFSVYGEQLDRMHCNQTLVTVVMGD